MKYRMPVRIASLPQEDLALVVADVYEILFFDERGLTPDKDLGSEHLAEIVNVFHRAGLAPVPVEEPS